MAIFFLGIAHLSFASTSANDFIPKWRVGERWVVEANYRDLRNPGDIWMAPIRWVFKVRAIKNIFQQDCYVIQIYPQKGNINVQAILWLAVKDLQALKVIDIYSLGGKVKKTEREFNQSDPQPLLTNNSIVPYDLPVFPLTSKANTQNADGFDAYKTSAPEKTYSNITKIGGLSFKRTFKQKSKSPDKQYADAFSQYTRGGQTFQVEISNGKSNGGIVQLWKEGSPWAISSESRDRKVKLIPSSAPTPLPDDSENGGDQ